MARLSIYDQRAKRIPASAYVCAPSRPSHAFKLFLAERLEERTLLAGTPTNVFARFDGMIGSPNGSNTVRVHRTSQNFAIANAQATLGFVVTPAQGSGLAPRPVA